MTPRTMYNALRSSTGLVFAEDFLVKALDGLQGALTDASTRTDGDSLDLLSKSHRVFFSYSQDHGDIEELKAKELVPKCLGRPSKYYDFEARLRQITNEELDVLFTNLDRRFLSQFQDEKTFKKYLVGGIDWCVSNIKYKLNPRRRGYHTIYAELSNYCDSIEVMFKAASAKISFDSKKRYRSANFSQTILALVKISEHGLRHLTKNGGGLDGNNANLKPFLHEFLELAELYNVQVFVITDAITTIFLQFDSSDGLTVSLKYRVISVEDRAYPLQAVLAAVIYDRYMAAQQNTYNKVVLPNLRMKAEDEIKVRNEEFGGHFSRVSLLDFQVQRDRFYEHKVVYRDEEGSYLQKGDNHWAQVLRFHNKEVLLFFPWLGDIGSDDLVLKLCDYRCLYRYWESEKDEYESFQQFWSRMMNKFLTEVSCYERIQAYNQDHEQKIKTAKLYDYGIMHVVKNDKIQYSGPFILMSFLQQTVSPDSFETKKKIKEDGIHQLKLLHSIGINHRSVFSRNFRVNADGVHFFDFNGSHLYPSMVPFDEMDAEIYTFKEGSYWRL